MLALPQPVTGDDCAPKQSFDEGELQKHTYRLNIPGKPLKPISPQQACIASGLTLDLKHGECHYCWYKPEPVLLKQCETTG